MRFVIFGLTLSSSWGNGHATPLRAIIHSLHRRGHQVTFYEKDVPYYAAHRDLQSSRFCRLVLYQDWDAVRSEAIREARDSDVVLTTSYCPDGARINDEILELQGQVRAYYDLDAPVTLAHLRTGQIVEYIRPDQLREFDLVLSWTGGGALQELRETWGANFVRPLFGCVDPDVYTRQAVQDRFRCDLSYMGTYAADRQPKLDRLFLEPSRRLQERQFLIAGSLYPYGWSWGQNVTKLEHVAPVDHPAFYSSSRCTLNITRDDMAASGYCPSGRLFEAAACSTPIISDWFDGLNRFFSPGSEILLADSAEDVISAIQLRDDALEELARRARERTLDENTGAQRASELIAYCEQARDRENNDDPVDAPRQIDIREEAA